MTNKEEVTFNKNELLELIRGIFKETLIEVLTQRRDLLEDAMLEAFEDIGLVRAIEDGKTGEYMSKDEFLKKIDLKIASL